MEKHNIDAVFDADSRILILGSFPSVKSREEKFFYAHKQNRFWKVISSVFDCAEPVTVEEKKLFLLSHNIAVWDVLAQCEITGSSDSSIKSKSVIPNDISLILNNADIRRIYVNGKTAYRYYNRFLRPAVCVDAVCLPSTSPANAAYTLADLLAEWRQIACAVTDTTSRI